MNDNLRIIHYPPIYPLSVHLYITNECNLNCEKCYYRSADDEKKELSFHKIKELFQEWKSYKLTSIAIGGGEPLLHPDIEKIIHLGKEMGFFMAVTTNGTILKLIAPDRIHISYDKIHSSWRQETLIKRAINYYKDLGCKVGINHVVTDIDSVCEVNEVFHDVDKILLINEKPETRFNQWDKIERKSHYWLDACRKGLKCEQGTLSFHLNYDMQASICSNFKRKINYTNLKDTWALLKTFKCSIRDCDSNFDSQNSWRSFTHIIHNRDTIDGSTTPIPLEPNPESDEILIDMFELVMESHLLTDILHTLLLIEDKDTGSKFRFEYYSNPIFSDPEPPLKLPPGKDGARHMIKLVRALKNEEIKNLPEILHGIKSFDFEMSLYMNWKDFDDYIDFNVEVKTRDKKSDLMPTLIERRFKFGYYGDSLSDYDDAIDEKGNISYLSERFMNLFRPIRKMFHEKWPDKYVLMPIHIESKEEKEKFIWLMKKREKLVIDKSKYKKIEDFF